MVELLRIVWWIQGYATLWKRRNSADTYTECHHKAANEGRVINHHTQAIGLLLDQQ